MKNKIFVVILILVAAAAWLYFAVRWDRVSLPDFQPVQQKDINQGESPEGFNLSGVETGESLNIEITDELINGDPIAKPDFRTGSNGR